MIEGNNGAGSKSISKQVLCYILNIVEFVIRIGPRYRTHKPRIRRKMKPPKQHRNQKNLPPFWIPEYRT
jgi:hypothetical protein